VQDSVSVRVRGNRDRSVSRQTALARPAECRGVGLHSGAQIQMTLRPAAADSGVRFVRTDVPAGTGEIRAGLSQVIDNRLSTMLGNRHGVSVSTIEHLMAAFAGCGVDNVSVELDGPEVPVMDGSAAPFVRLIERAEIAIQDAPRRAIKVLKPVAVGDGTSMITLAPAETFSIDFSIDFAAPAIGHQALSVELVNGTFAEHIAAARTFGFAEDVERLRAAGLARGGSLDNAIVIDGARILNRDGLRFEDEFVRHKILDCIGDLYLAEAPIIARVTARRSGHATNHDLLRALFADPQAWTYCDQASHTAHARQAEAPQNAVA